MRFIFQEKEDIHMNFERDFKIVFLTITIVLTIVLLVKEIYKVTG
jgi:hypothetical protein